MFIIKAVFNIALILTVYFVSRTLGLIVKSNNNIIIKEVKTNLNTDFIQSKTATSRTLNKKDFDGTINHIFANTTDFGSNPIYEAFGKCNNSTCVHGNCSSNNTCVCNKGYAQLPNSNSNKLCNYKLYSQLKAFFLELFLVLGFGHLYCARILNFLLKLFIILLLLTIDIFTKYFLKITSYHSKKTVYVFSYIFYAAIVIWQVVDIIMFGLNYYKDGNGMPLWVYEG